MVAVLAPRIASLTTSVQGAKAIQDEIRTALLSCEESWESNADPIVRATALDASEHSTASEVDI